MPYPARPLADRFAEKYERLGPDECWPWLGALSGQGRYGVIGAGGKRGTNLYAHRVAWELANGPIPSGLTIDHLCGYKACVNPGHMEVVTQTENTRRAMKLTMDAAREIRVLAAAGVRQHLIAKQYAIDRSEISRVVSNEIWIDPDYIRPVLQRCGVDTRTGPCRRQAGWGTGLPSGPCLAHAC